MLARTDLGFGSGGGKKFFVEVLPTEVIFGPSRSAIGWYFDKEAFIDRNATKQFPELAAVNRI